MPEMSARTRIRDILRRFLCRNVRERRYHGHFELISSLKCPREHGSETFCFDFTAKMSTRTRIRDILYRFHRRNVRENTDQRHFEAISSLKCPREAGSKTFCINFTAEMSTRNVIMDILNQIHS